MSIREFAKQLIVILLFKKILISFEAENYKHSIKHKYEFFCVGNNKAHARDIQYIGMIFMFKHPVCVTKRFIHHDI